MAKASKKKKSKKNLPKEKYVKPTVSKKELLPNKCGECGVRIPAGAMLCDNCFYDDGRNVGYESFGWID